MAEEAATSRALKEAKVWNSEQIKCGDVGWCLFTLILVATRIMKLSLSSVKRRRAVAKPDGHKKTGHSPYTPAQVKEVCSDWKFPQMLSFFIVV